MLGTLPIMLVLSPVILFQLGSVIKGTSRKKCCFLLGKFFNPVAYTCVTIIGHHMCNEGCHFLSGGMSSCELMLVKNTPPDPAGFS